MKKLTAVAIVLAAVLAGALGVAAASGGGRAATIELVARQTASGEVVPPDAQGLLGARFVGSDDLFVGEEPVGRGGRSCEAVGGDGQGSGLFLCTIALDLEDGQLTAQALVELSQAEPAAFTAAITGGTGEHRQARGTLDARQVTETEISYVARLR